jgi:hypothetical protein
MRIRIDDAGRTLPEPGAPNAKVCLQSNSDQFFQFYFRTVLGQETPATAQ